MGGLDRPFHPGGNLAHMLAGKQDPPIAGGDARQIPRPGIIGPGAEAAGAPGNARPDDGERRHEVRASPRVQLLQIRQGDAGAFRGRQPREAQFVTGPVVIIGDEAPAAPKAMARIDDVHGRIIHDGIAAMDAIVQFPETAPEFQFDLDPGLVSKGTDDALGLGREIGVDAGQEDKGDGADGLGRVLPVQGAGSYILPFRHDPGCVLTEPDQFGAQLDSARGEGRGQAQRQSVHAAGQGQDRRGEGGAVDQGGNIA